MAYANPGEAATSTIPADAVKVLDTSVSPDGQHAVVLIAVGDPSVARIFEVLCALKAEGWDEVSDSGGPGWTWIPDRVLGVTTEWEASEAGRSGLQSVDWNAPEPPTPSWPPFSRAGPTW